MRIALVLALASMVGLWLLSDEGAPERVQPRETSPAADADPAPSSQPTPEPTPSRAKGDGLEGSVVDEQGRPIANAVVTSESAQTTTAADGRFVLGGHHRQAWASAPGYARQWVSWQWIFEDRRIELRRGGALTGVVRNEQGDPIPGASVRSEDKEAPADASGTYRLEDLSPGFVRAMEARAPDGAWQKLARLPEVRVRQGATTPFDPVVVAGATISGTAPANAVILLHPDRARTTADAQGRFQFVHVAPGRYSVQLEDGFGVDVRVGVRDQTDIVLKPPGFGTLVVRGADGPVRVSRDRPPSSPDAEGQVRFERVRAREGVRIYLRNVHRGTVTIRAGETTEFVIPPARFVFAGVVVKPDGSAVFGARVECLDESAETASWTRHSSTPTDVTGRFRIPVRSDGPRFALVVNHPEFAPAAVRRLDASADDLRVVLQRGATIEGVVVRPSGEPLAGRFVRALRESPHWIGGGGLIAVSDYLDDGPRLPRFARSDESGRFRLVGLSHGRYWVGARTGFGDDVLTDAPPIRIVIREREDASIEGIIVDPRGARVPSAIVTTGRSRSSSDTHGRFRLRGLADGAHVLRVEPQETQLHGASSFRPVTARGVEAGRDDVVIRISDGRTIRGRILDHTGAPLSRARVTLLPPPPPEEPGIGSRPHTPETTTDADGRFLLRGLEPGPVELAVFRRGAMPLVFVVKGDEAGDQRLAAGESVRGVLRDAGGKPAAKRWLHLKLKEPARSADVEPWRRDWRRFLSWFETWTEVDGSFVFEGLPAGEYELTQRGGKDLTPMRVTTGTDGLALQLLALSEITGVVVDENGQPVFRSGGRRLKISAHHRSGQIGFIPVGDDGTFRFRRVPQGRIRLDVIGWSEFESKKVWVEAGARDVRVQLEPSRFRGLR
ncbi:MAG: carboxypeptidase-like regulatory domain-containing protein [Planctomycetota bacterium]